MCKAATGRKRNELGSMRIKNGVWTAAYTVTEDGRNVRKYVNLHTADRDEAVAKLRAIMAVPADADYKRRLSTAVELVGGRVEPIRGMGDRYEARNGGWGARGATANAGMYASRVKMFETWAATQGIEDMQSVAASTARRYRDHLAGRGLAPNTVSQHCGLLQRVWSVLLEESDRRNPWKGVAPRSSSATVRKEVLTDAQVDALLSAALDEGEDVHGLFVVGRDTGLREGDAVRIKFADVDLKAGTLTVVPSKTAGSSGATVTVPLTSDLVFVLRKAGRSPEAMRNNPEGYVFPRLARIYSEGKAGRERMSWIVRRVFRAAGIECNAKGNGRRQAAVYGFHSLRHGYVTRLIESGVSSEIVQAAVGHSTAAMTAHYTHLTDAGVERIRAAMGDAAARIEMRASSGRDDWLRMLAEDRAKDKAAKAAEAEAEAEAKAEAKKEPGADNADNSNSADDKILKRIAELADMLSAEARAKLADKLK